MANPYRTDAEIKQGYNKQYNQYKNTMTEQADRQKADVNSKYDSSQRNNYVQYMMNKKDLPEQMAKLGISGGASETSALRQNTNYENNYNNLERGRNSDIAGIDNSLRDTLNAYKMTADENMRNELAQERTNRANWKQAQQEQREDRYAKTISGFNNVANIDKIMKNIKKGGKDLWRIPYLRARRAELLQAQGGSGGGGSSSSRTVYRNGGGGGGGKTPTTKLTKEQQAKRDLITQAQQGKKGFARGAVTGAKYR